MVTVFSVAEYSLLEPSLLHLNTKPACLSKFEGESQDMERALAVWKGHFEN